MARDYNQQNPDGSWWHVTQDDNGNYTHTVISDPTSGAGDGKTYPTRTGDKTIAQIRHEMNVANPGGGYDTMDSATLLAAYNSVDVSTGASALATASQKLLDAIASGDTQKFDEAVREFNATLTQQQADAAEKAREFGVTSGQTAADAAEKAREFNAGNYSSLAQSLLNTASQLRGPKDYYQFQQYTSGGKDLMSQLFGNQPRPDFSQPTGTIEPETITDLMQKLGFTQSPIAATAAASGAPPPAASGAPPPAPGSYNTVNGVKTVDEMLAELDQAAGGHWDGDRSPAGVAAGYASTTKSPVTPVSTSTPPSGSTFTPAAPAAAAPQAATAKPAAATLKPLALTNGVEAGTAASPAASPSGAGDTGADPAPPLTPAVPKTPLPYQINPAVWDSLGPVGQALTLSAATANGWDEQEFMRQLNAQRPSGVAPAATQTQFKTPMGSF